MSESVRNEEGMNENTNAAIEFVDGARFASIAVMFPEKEISLEKEKSGIACVSLSIEGKTFCHKLLNDKGINSVNLSGTDFAALAVLYPESEVKLEMKNGNYGDEDAVLIETLSIQGEPYSHELVRYTDKDGVSKGTLLLLDRLFPNSPVNITDDTVSISIANRTFNYRLKRDETARVEKSDDTAKKAVALNESDFATIANCFDDAEITMKNLTFRELKKIDDESESTIGDDLIGSAKPKSNDRFLFESIVVNDVEFLHKLVTYKKIDDNDLSDAQFALIANLNPNQEITLETSKRSIFACVTVGERKFCKELVNYGKKTNGITIVNDASFKWLKDTFGENTNHWFCNREGIYDVVTIEGKDLGCKMFSMKECSDPIGEIQGIDNASIIKLPYNNGCTAALISLTGRSLYYHIYAYNKTQKREALEIIVAFAKKEVKKLNAIEAQEVTEKHEL